MANILFIIPDPTAPSSRVRVLNMVPELEKRGVESTVVLYPRNKKEQLDLIRKSGRYDLVVLQKRLPSRFFLSLLSVVSQRLAFDFDDAIYFQHDSNETMSSPLRMRRFIMTARKVNLVMTGNQNLSDFARQFNNRVVVIPSTVETRNVPVKSHYNEDDKTIIGWVGGANNLIHLNHISPILQNLACRYPIELRILSSQTLEIPGVVTSFVPWQLETQDLEIAKFDIGIMPLPDNIHTRGKCGYKALQYMSAKVPPVVSDVGINSQIVEHDSEGMVASSPEAFFSCLKRLIENPSLRRKLGAKARRKVEKEFSLHVIGRQLAETLTESTREYSKD